ncbi:hypothetical protein HME9304_00184 [Flagellimonas maritima]|uniref:Hemerythrin-like domain-containing protein n=1 Tax=Flagellimonas maritima TaxID=1383885 RepID=A0A2Z4LPP2_9FLAO|nr:hemerythrin domain-containing protein [Allomuricauda aurantiaca]AWX43197.1 hypothetical protein HME9304_00184 [Allomuricauda aurantiaca]
MKTIFEALRVDHDKQRSLLDKLVNTTGDSEDRNTLYGKLKEQLEQHADAEERFFYKPLISADITQEKARHSIAEHHEIDELLEELDDTEYSSPAWLVTAKKLKEKVEHHLDEEEQEVFQLAGKALKDNQKKDLAVSYENYMKDKGVER